MTFNILENVPDTVLNDIRNSWGKDDFSNKEMYKCYEVDEYQDYIIIKKPHKLYEILGEYFKSYFVLTFLINPPNSGLGPVHTDGSRVGCVNFPINVDLYNSCFFVSKENLNPTIRIPDDEETADINPGGLRFEYEPEKYIFYNLKKPVAFSTKNAHGVFNYSNEKRVLLSVSFPDAKCYQDIFDQIPEEWL